MTRFPRQRKAVHGEFRGGSAVHGKKSAVAPPLNKGNGVTEFGADWTEPESLPPWPCPADAETTDPGWECAAGADTGLPRRSCFGGRADPADAEITSRGLRSPADAETTLKGLGPPPDRDPADAEITYRMVGIQLTPRSHVVCSGYQSRR